MKQFLFLFFFVFIQTIYVNANTIEARVFTTNRNEIRCGIKLPDLKTKKLTCYDENGKSFQMNCDTVSHIIAWHKNTGEENSFKMYYTNYKQYKGKSDQTEVKKKFWFFFQSGNESIMRLAMAQKYSINKNGTFTAKSTGSGGFKGEIWYLYQRPGEDMPTLIAMDYNTLMNANSYFRMYGQHYFKDCHELAEKIESKELKCDKLNTVMEFYHTHCGKGK